MKNALILHGTQGNANENWYPWLKKELEKEGCKVWLPDLPGADEPNLNKYNQFILENKDWVFDQDSLIIGHSSGAVAALAILNELPEGVAINKCVLVASFEKKSPGGQWEPNKHLFDYQIDLKNIKNKAKEFVLIISDNDKYCPVEYVENLRKELGGKFVLTHGDGHFSVSSGGEKYKELSLLLKYL